MEKVISMSQLSKDTKRIAKDIETSGTVYRIRRPGRRSMVLVDHQYMERWRATCEFIAQHPNWEQELRDSDLEYSQGKFIPLDDVLKRLGLDEGRSKPPRRKATRARASSRRSKAR